MLFKGACLRGFFIVALYPDGLRMGNFKDLIVSWGPKITLFSQLGMVHYHYARSGFKRENTSSKKFANVIDPAAALERFRSCLERPRRDGYDKFFDK